MTAGERISEPHPSGHEGRYGLALLEPAGKPTFSFGVLLASGEEGAKLRVTQARALEELLTWAETSGHDERGERPGWQ